MSVNDPNDFPSPGTPGLWTERKATRKPDYTVGAMNIRSGTKLHNAGGAWINDDDSISIIFNPFTSIDTLNPDVRLRLFPREDEPKSRKGSKK